MRILLTCIASYFTALIYQPLVTLGIKTTKTLPSFGKFSARPTSFGGENNTRDENFSQAELGIEFGDEEFGSFWKDQLKCFLDQEEADCLQANPFIEEEQCKEPADSSMFSG